MGYQRRVHGECMLNSCNISMLKLLTLLVVPLAHLAGGVPAPKAKNVPQPPRFDFQEVTGAGTYKVGDSALLLVLVTDNDVIEENDEWKFCRWTRESDGVYCKFTFECDGILCDIGVGDFYVTTYCSSTDLSDRITYHGEDPNVHNRICGLKFSSLTKADSPKWRVDVEECKVTGCGSNNGNGNVISTELGVRVK